MTPGDTLTLQPGTYAALTVAVSGTPNNKILIRGQAVDGQGHSTSMLTGTLTITGQYLHIARLYRRTGGVGFSISGARHVALEGCRCTDVTAQGYLIRNNSQNIYMRNCEAGEFAALGSGGIETMTAGFRVGTPSASWSGGVPDATNNITFTRCYTQDVQGNGFEFFEGCQRIRAWDCYATYDGISWATTNPLPAYASYFSQATDVQFERCASFYPPTYAYTLKSITVGAVKYGVRQHIWKARTRDPWDGVYASNDATHFEYYGLISGSIQHSGRPVWVDLAPSVTTWLPDRVNSVIFPYARLAEWGSVASDYCLYPENKNEFGLFKHFYGERPEVIYDVGYYNNQPYGKWTAAGTEFEHTEEDHQVRCVRIGYFQAWHTAYATYGAVFDMYTRTMVPNSFIALNPPITNYWGWVHTDLPIETPAILWPNRAYRVVVWGPPEAVFFGYGGQQGQTMGLFPDEYWARYDGADGVRNMIVSVPRNADASDWKYQYLNEFDGKLTDRNSKGSQIWADYPAPEPPDAHILADGITHSTWYPRAGLGFAAAMNWLVDAVIGYYREPEDTTVPPGTGLQGALDNLIPGDVLTLTGTHLVSDTLVLRPSGTANRPITIKGDGTAILRGAFGTDTCYDALRIKGNYVKLENFIIEQFGRGLVLEGPQHVKVKQVTTRTIRGTGHSCQDGSRYVYYDGCVAYDTGTDLNTGDGFRCGTTPSAWPAGDINVPETTKEIRYDNCQAYRNYGDGFDANSGASTVVFKGCSVNHSLGNIPPTNLVAGTSGFHSKADKIQFINCSVIAAPTAGYRCFDVLWSGVIYGRGQQVKGGSSTAHGQGGVVSQSDDMKVYSDFTASAPRVVEVEGGWVAAGSNVNPTTFVEFVWSSPAAAF